MTLAYVVLPVLAALVLMIVAPALLTRGRWQVSHPRIALLLWFCALAAGCGAAAASVVLATIAACVPDPSRSVLESTALVVLSWMTLAAAGAAVAHVVSASEPFALADRRVRGLAAVATSREKHHGFVLIRLRSEEPVVAGVAGPEPAIWLSDGAERMLSATELRAVLAHEYAHLRGRHHWVMRIAAVNARCVPRVLPAGRALRSATALLVELIADDAAARHAGPAELANALVTLGRASAAPGMEMRAERLTRRRWPSPSRRQLPSALRLSA